jgi:tricarballylate dehydrogenase
MSTDAADIRGPWDLVVVGHGFAGLSAAVAFLEARPESASRVAVIDSAPRSERGGATRWAAGIFGLTDTDTRLSATLRWLKSHGVGARPIRGLALPGTPSTWYCLAGGGRAFIERYDEQATRLGARFFDEVELRAVEREPGGRITGVEVRTAAGEVVMRTAAVVLASGGFESDTATLARRIPGGDRLEPSSPGARQSTGAGIAAATAVGGARTGAADTAYLLPIDPRSDRTAPIVGTWLRGILVDLEGRRLVDDGEHTASSPVDTVARAVLAHGGLAFAITDATARGTAPTFEELHRTDQPVIVADSIAELADRLGMDAAVLEKTVAEYDAAIAGLRSDGDRPEDERTAGASPEKSNGPQPLTEPPFEALPVGAQVAFTTDGLRVDETARVLDEQGDVIPGLYAAGAASGAFVEHAHAAEAPCLRAVLTGRLAGTEASSPPR